MNVSSLFPELRIGEPRSQNNIQETTNSSNKNENSVIWEFISIQKIAKCLLDICEIFVASAGSITDPMKSTNQRTAFKGTRIFIVGDANFGTNFCCVLHKRADQRLLRKVLILSYYYYWERLKKNLVQF